MKSKQPRSLLAGAALLLPVSVDTRYSLDRTVKPDPQEYTHFRQFALDYCHYNAFRKMGGAGDKQRLRDAAVAAFHTAESRNKATNNRLRTLSLSGPAIFCLDEARKEIKRLLGRFDVASLFGECEWGPGATATLKAVDASLDNKLMERKLSVTRRALPYARTLLEYDLNWFSARVGQWCEEYSVLPSEFSVVDSGRFTTVPKDNKTDRGIDVQPTMNLYLQKGMGKLIRRRLKRVGIDLDDQSRNQYLARVAQRLGLATIDLAQASDSLCYELVKLLLPECWFKVLNDLRTPSVTGVVKTDDDSVPYALEKFSAMGNGYTFELESLIFWALGKAVYSRFGLDDEYLRVYGDDIIVDSVVAPALIALLGESGFVTNEDKTYLTGRFYESCGKHYFDGVDVTPFFQKEEVVDVPSACRFANRVLRWAHRLGRGDYYDHVAYPTWQFALHLTTLLTDELNIRRWERWVHDPVSKDGRLRKEPVPHPVPYIPWWLEDDFGICVPEEFQIRNSMVSFDRLVFSSNKKAAQEEALLAVSLRRGVVVETPFNGLIALRNDTSTTWGRGKTSPVRDSVPQWV